MDGQRKEGLISNDIHFTNDTIFDVLAIEVAISLYMYLSPAHYVTQGGDVDRIRRNL
jgi:hypothetical protein